MTSRAIPLDELDKHLRRRIENCLGLARLSNCPRRQFGAMLYNPISKQALGDSYNGGPRGGGRLCGGEVCLRDRPPSPWTGKGGRWVRADGREVARSAGPGWLYRKGLDWIELPSNIGCAEEARLWVDVNLPAPPIPSGTQTEIGCHHAEMNLITNAAAEGIAVRGLWVIVTGEPCMICAKLIHHAGITRVVCIEGGYAGGGAGPAYLEAHGVEVMRVEGPQDPRTVGTPATGPEACGG